jgi:uncharacterized membrane protein (DUF485 family)
MTAPGENAEAPYRQVRDRWSCVGFATYISVFILDPVRVDSVLLIMFPRVALGPLRGIYITEVLAICFCCELHSIIISYLFVRRAILPRGTI